MNELDVLRTVRSERRLGWGAVEYTYRQFRADLSIAGVHGTDLSDSAISNILNDRSGIDDGKILNLITGEASRARAARKAIENSLRPAGPFRLPEPD